MKNQEITPRKEKINSLIKTLLASVSVCAVAVSSAQAQSENILNITSGDTPGNFGATMLLSSACQSIEHRAEGASAEVESADSPRVYHSQRVRAQPEDAGQPEPESEVETAGDLPARISETVLFRHDFSGASGAGLNGVAVDVGDQTWTAGPAFRADGRISGGHGGAWLNFTPEAGNVYTLSAELAVDGVNNNWVGLGFAQNPGVALNGSLGRHSNNAAGIAWVIHRVNGTTNPNQSFFAGPATHKPLGNFQIETMTTRVVITLDTRDPANVRASLSLDDGAAVVSATSIGSLSSLGIRGLGFSNDHINTGRVANFSLSVLADEAVSSN